jgi:hypothetical protein
MKALIKNPFFWITLAAVVAAIIYAAKAKAANQKATKIEKQSEASPFGKFGNPNFLTDLFGNSTLA